MGDNIAARDITVTTRQTRLKILTSPIHGISLSHAWGGSLLLSLLSLGLMVPVGLAEPLHPRIAQQSAPQAAPATPEPPPEVTTPPQRVSRPTLRLGSEGGTVSELQAMLKLMGYYNDVIDGVYQDSTQSAVAQFQQAAGLSADGIVGPATWNRLFPDPPTAANPPASSPADPATPPAASGSNPPPDSPTQSDPAAAFPPDPNPDSTGTSEGDPPSTANPSQDEASNGSETNAPVDFPILRRGMYGPAIVRLQERLKSLDFYQGSLDGIFGPATEAAVQQAQRHYQLTPDGIVGPATWSALLR